MRSFFLPLLFRWASAGAIVLLSFLILPFLLSVTLRVTFGILHFFTQASLEDQAIRIGTTTLAFIPACAALSAYTLLAVLILLTRDISFQKGMILFLYGSIVLFSVNILRIELLIYILLHYSMDFFQTLHLFVWKIVSSIFVALVWVFLSWRFRIRAIPIYSDIHAMQQHLKL